MMQRAFVPRHNFLLMAIFTLVSVSVAFAWGVKVFAFSGQGERLVKRSDNTAVYLINQGRRYIFPDEKTYRSWYGKDYSMVVSVSAEELSNYIIAGNVTHKPGSLIKIQSDPRVYEVLDAEGTIQWVPSEADAVKKYGPNWAKRVVDVPVYVFVNYKIVGDPGSGVALPPPTKDQTPAQPEKEVGLVRLTINEYGDRGPKIAWSGSRYGVIWTENDYYDNRMFAMILDERGNSINKVKLTDYLAGYKIVWDGSNFAIAWIASMPRTENDPGKGMTKDVIFFSKMDENGVTVIPPQEVLSLSAGSGGLDLATDNQGGFGLVWNASVPEGPPSTGNQEIFYLPLDPEGKAIGLPKALTQFDPQAAEAMTYSARPKIVWNGSSYGIFWVDRRNDTVLDRDDVVELYYQQIAADGSRLTGETRLTITNLTTGLNSKVVWDGSAYGIVYDEVLGEIRDFQGKIIRPGVDNRKIARIGTDGTVQWMTKIANNAGGGLTLDIAFANGHYYVVDGRKEVSGRPQDDSELYVTVVDGRGVKIKEARLTYDPNPSHEPAVAGAGDKIGAVWVDYRGCPDCSQNTVGKYPAELFFTTLK